MKYLPSIAIAAALSCAARAEIVRTVEKTLTVQAGGMAEILALKGDITVATGPDDSVHIVARERIRANSPAEADSLLENLDLKMGRYEGRVVAWATYGKTTGFRWSDCPVQVDFIVTVPSRFSVALKSTGGAIKVADLDGSVKARTSGGSLTLGRIGGRIDGQTSGGEVRMLAARGAVHLATGGGHITVTDVKVASLRASAADSGTPLQEAAPAGGADEPSVAGGDLAADRDDCGRPSIFQPSKAL